jgi:hypothetical protein
MAMTHVDAYRLDREDFDRAMRDNPSAAVTIADALATLFGRDESIKASQQIYKLAGIDKVLSLFTAGRWRPSKGLAAKIHALAASIKAGTHSGYAGPTTSKRNGGAAATSRSPVSPPAALRATDTADSGALAALRQQLDALVERQEALERKQESALRTLSSRFDDLSGQLAVGFAKMNS